MDTREKKHNRGQVFDAPVLGGGQLKKRAVQGGAYILMARVLTQTARLGVTAILARLLAPDDFGLVAIIMAMVGVGSLVQDMGLSAAVVQRERITANQISALYWLNVLLGGITTLIVFSLAPAIASVFHRPDAIPIAAALAFNFLLSSMSIQHGALLQRQMRFKVQVRIGFSSMSLSSLVAVLIAWQGGGPWALVAQTLLSRLLSLIMLGQASGFRPGRFRWESELLSMLKFGGGFLIFRIFGFVAQNLQLVLIGRYLGAGEAGLFSRAYHLTMQLLGYANIPASKVATATLPRLVDSPERFRHFYLRCMRVMMLVTAPLAVYLGMFSTDVVYALLGSQWTFSGELLRVFAVGLLWQPVMYSTGWIYLARGNMRGLLNWGIFGWTVMIVASVVGLRWGSVGVAWAWTVGMFLLVVPCCVFAFRGTSIQITDVVGIVVGPLALALVAGLPAGLFAHEYNHLSVFLRLPVATIIFALAFMGLIGIIPQQRQLALNVYREFRGPQPTAVPSTDQGER